jgi:hypothetical protein
VRNRLNCIHRRIAVATMTAVVFGLLVAVLAPAPASAGVRGPCSASINGRSVAGLSLSKADAIRVGRDSNVRVAMAARQPMTHYRITLSFRGRSWTIKDEDIAANRWAGVIPARLYARYGVGFYTVRATSTGPGVSCSGEVLIKVV